MEPQQHDTDILLNDACAVIGALAAVLRTIAEQSGEPEIVNVARLALADPTLNRILSRE